MSMSDGEQAESRDVFEQAEPAWADNRAQPYTEHRLLYDTIAGLLGESRERGCRPVTEAITVDGQEFTVTVEAHPAEEGSRGRLF